MAGVGGVVFGHIQYTVYLAQKPDIHRCTHSSRDELGVYAQIQNIFGTQDLTDFAPPRMPFCMNVYFQTLVSGTKQNPSDVSRFYIMDLKRRSILTKVQKNYKPASGQFCRPTFSLFVRFMYSRVKIVHCTVYTLTCKIFT